MSKNFYIPVSIIKEKNNKLSSTNIKESLNNKNKLYNKDNQLLSFNGMNQNNLIDINDNDISSNIKPIKKNIKNSYKKRKRNIQIKQINNGKIIFEIKKLNNKNEYQNKEKSFNSKKEIINNSINEHEKIYVKDNSLNSSLLNYKDNKKEKDEKEINNERPEDISDYISIDEYNKNEYKDLNGKITNEAIEEVEEAKEVSELRQSSELYNNISNTQSSQKQIKTCSFKDIGTKKNIYNEKKIEIKKKINRSLTLQNKDISNKNKKISSKIKKKKILKNNSLHINVFSSKDSKIIKDYRNIRITRPMKINSYLNLTDKNSKHNKDNIFIKKNIYSNKTIDNKTQFCINSNKSNKDTQEVAFKKIPINNYKNQNSFNKNKPNQINNKKIRITNINIKRKIEIYKKTSKTMPNLKKNVDSKIENDDTFRNRIELIKYINNNNNKNENTKKIKGNNFSCKDQILKSVKNRENNKTKNKLINRNNDSNYNQVKLFPSNDKIKKINKTSDKMKIPIAIYNKLLNEDEMKLRMKKIKKFDEKYHKLFKDYYSNLNLNINKDILNKNNNHIFKYNSYSNSIKPK